MTFFELFKVFYNIDKTMKTMKTATIENYKMIDALVLKYTPDQLEQMKTVDVESLFRAWDNMQDGQKFFIQKNKEDISLLRRTTQNIEVFVPNLFKYKVTKTINFLDECQKEMVLFQVFLCEQNKIFQKNTAQFKSK